ncbi:helix-turn-helix domain-containing protein [Peribacillus alkalitolerans]|uniref:helix-turn-helix domain-containing protein n=1 Tax=Peribacillus alkalitolerans TaxID=1550385 RepID=UPI0013D8603E|nr:helix-turn-helix domain-containing protein [Peribacillus alkalitolerans]
MDFSAIGQKIKELRKQSGLSQVELAEGICTQAQISKIEKGDVYPYASTLYLISDRLGVDVNYFFDIGMTPRLDYVQEVMNQLKMARKTRNYKEIEEIIIMEGKNPLFIQNKRNYQVLLWNKGICEYELYKNLEGSIKILNEAINLTHTTEKIYSERELEILLSIGVIYSEDNQLNQALSVYENAHVHLKALPFLNDHSIKTRILYSIAWTETRLKKYQDSIKHCEEAIRWCLQKDNMLLLGELHYHLGYNYELKGKIQEAYKYMNKAKLIFELQNEKNFTSFIEKKLLDWQQNHRISI